MCRGMAVAEAVAVALVTLTVCTAAAAGSGGPGKEGGERGVRGEVTYDGRALLVDGTRRMLFSGEMHYTRSTPEVIASLL